jgi:hypothetical protein
MPITEFLNPNELPHRSQEKPTFDKNMGFYYRRLPAYNAELNQFGAQVSERAAFTNAKADAAEASAKNAEASLQAAIAAVGVSAWVSGATYQKNVCAISQLNFQTYRRRAAGAGTTDPANDAANWALLTGSGSFIPQPVPASSVDLSLGNYHLRSMGANTTLTFDNCPQDGFSFTLELTVVGGVLTLPTSVKTPDDVPYTLTAGKTHLLMFATSNRGARWRLAAATNYTT